MPCGSPVRRVQGEESGFNGLKPLPYNGLAGTSGSFSFPKLKKTRTDE